MGAIDLHKVAVTMGKVIKFLSEFQHLKNGDDVYAHKDEFCAIAYMCRVGILDRIERNSYMLNPRLPIKIPTGVFSGRKETMDSALNLTIGRLKEIVSKDIVTENYINDILNRQEMFYILENSLPDNLKRRL